MEQLKAALRAILPRHLWLVAARMSDRFSRMYYRRRMAMLPEWPAVSGVTVCYGGVLSKGTGNSMVLGGRVKLLDLLSVYPEQCQGFNILYLVSSALPQHPGELVRWAKSRGARFVLNQNGVSYPGWAGPDWEKLNEPNRELLAMTDLVIYQSEYCRVSADRYLGLAPGSSVIQYNAIDTQTFVPSSKPQAEVLVLLVAGSHQQPQRVISVLDALVHLVDEGLAVHLIISGRCTWQDGVVETQNTIERLGLSAYVEITGPYGRDEAPDLYRRADILVHTKYKDPCPTVVIEAMASGLPVVGSASGGMPELVGEDAGILLPVPDTWDDIPVPGSVELAGAIREIAADLPRWKRHARERAVSNFDVQPWVTHHRELFTALTGRKEQA